MAHLVEVQGQRLFRGNCLDVLPHARSGSVDMVFADLPYGVTANKWDTPLDLLALWAELLRIGKPRCAYVFTAAQPFATALVNSQPKLFRYDLVWRKGRATGVMNCRGAPLRIHESILIFCQSKTFYNPQMWDAGKPRHSNRSGGSGSSNYGTQLGVQSRVANDRYPLSVLDLRNRENGLHPTQKPVALLEWLIRTYSNPGDTILDPTMGSGTTLVACHRTGRLGRGIEKDATYFDTAHRRLLAETQQADLVFGAQPSQ